MPYADPQERKEYSKRYFQLHREKFREYNRRWKRANPEKILAEYIRNKDKYIARAKKWKEANLQKYREISKRTWKKWYNRTKLEKPEYYKFRNSSHYHKRSDAKGNHTLEEWEKLKKKFNYTCQVCGKKEPEIKLVRDHIRPLSKGGSNYIKNIQPLCNGCNIRKRDKWK